MTEGTFSIVPGITLAARGFVGLAGAEGFAVLRFFISAREAPFDTQCFYLFGNDITFSLRCLLGIPLVEVLQREVWESANEPLDIGVDPLGSTCYSE